MWTTGLVHQGCIAFEVCSDKVQKTNHMMRYHQCEGIISTVRLENINILTTHSICGRSPVDTNTVQSTLLSIRLKASTSNRGILYIAYVKLTPQHKWDIGENFMAPFKDPGKKTCRSQQRHTSNLVLLN